MGDACSIRHLGVMYEDGLGVEKSYERAAELYKAAADAGDADGLCALGNLYAGGLGVEHSDEEAVRLFRLAAGCGSAWGQRNLGFMYENGRGVPKSEEDAARMYRLAARQGDAYAKGRLAAMSSRPPAPEKAHSIRERILDRALGAEREADELISIVECLLHSGTISEEEADGILLAAAGEETTVTLRTTEGLSARLLRLVGRFNKKADYFISWPFGAVSRSSMASNGVDSLEAYSRSDVMALKGPFIYSSGELERILLAIEDIERGIRPGWGGFKKFAYLHSRIISTITYHDSWEDSLYVIVPPYGCNKARYDDNSLRGLVSGFTICLGFSVILGELLLRQGIENHIAINEGHAYSVVKLDGSYCVTDLVQDRVCLEATGDFGKLFWEGRRIGDFMSEEKHRLGVSLFPDRKDPRLSMVDESRYRSATASLLMRRYDMTTLRLSFSGGDVHVAQIGSVDIEGKAYFQYLYQGPDGGKPPVLVHSRNNLCEIMSNKRSGILDPVLEEKVMSRFDPSNVADSLRYHSGDIGTVYHISKTGQQEIKRVWKETAMVDGRFLSFRRRDGAAIMVVPTADIPVAVRGANVLLHRYRIFVSMRKGDGVTYRGYSVSTETDLFRMTGEREARCVADDLLGDESLITAVRDRCGYVGMVLRYDDVCVVATDSRLRELLSSDAPETERFTWRCP